MAALDVRTQSSGALLGTGTLTVRERDVEVAAGLSAVTLTMPEAGRFLVSSVVTSKPHRGSQPSVVQQTDATVSAGGTVTVAATETYHANKDFEAGAGGSIVAHITVQRYSGTWQPYAASAIVTQAFDPAPAPRAQIRGANVHLFGAGQGLARTLPLLDAAQDLGMDMIRTSVPWGFYEPADNAYDSAAQSMVDGFMSACASRGLQVVLILGTAPGWAATSGQSTVTSSWNGTTYSFINNYRAPTDWAKYEEFVTYFINRYGTELYAIEPLNEPNGVASSVTADVVAWHQHAKAGVAASSRPTVKVVGGTISWTDQAYLQTLFAAGLEQWCDAISVHPYPVKFTPSQAYSPRVPMPNADWNHGIASAGALKDITALPIWVTECGYCSNFSALSYGSEARQADYLDYSFKQLARIQNIDAVVMHSLEDAGRSGDGVTPARSTEWQSFGLLRVDHVSRKPSYAQMKTTLAALP